jgi:predicted nucleotide-binding protein
MTNSDTPIDPGFLTLLKDKIDAGHKIAAKTDLHAGSVRMWSGSIRSLLRKTFGPDSEILNLWPTPDISFPKEKAREVLLERINIIERMVDAVSSAAVSALMPNRGGRVFIGHGRSLVWRELKDFLQDRLHLPWEEFNRESAAGIATTERLTQMLEISSFAFLIMTAEDEHADETLHARENVIHEVGLFQGKLGMKRAIILLERGCQEFSNIHGLTHIPFPQGHISAAFEDIRRVLERERIIEK